MKPNSKPKSSSPRPGVGTPGAGLAARRKPSADGVTAKPADPFLRATAVWLALAALAILNGLFRSLVMTPWIGDPAGHLISTALLCVAIFVVTWCTISWIGPSTRRGALLIGVLWVGMTIAFEFVAGHYLFGNSWEKLFTDYNVARGRVWSLVLVATLLAPRLVSGMRGLMSPPVTSEHPNGVAQPGPSAIGRPD